MNDADGDHRPHTHTHTHPHTHDDLTTIEARIQAIESAYAEHAAFDTAQLDQMISPMVDEYSPLNGAKVVARSWVDPSYRERLLTDGTAAIAELGFGGFQAEHLIAVENSPDVHNLVVCTLCSCYPWPVLGFPPEWYKEPAYRARAVREPRALLAEMGTPIPESVEVCVWDSTAETRYLVIPERPPGTEHLTEEELAALVTRDSMIGVERL